MALDEIRLGRQKRMIVIGAEDCNFESIVPFCGMRALSLDTDPDNASRSFDVSRNGFVGTGGSVCMVLETESEAKEEMQHPTLNLSAGGKDLMGTMLPFLTPEGRGLQGAMENALIDAKLSPTDIDYVNAHAPSTSIGDASEMKALKATFPFLKK